MANEIATAAMTARLRLPDVEEKDKPKRRPIPDHVPQPTFGDLERRLAEQLNAISGKSPPAAAIRYALTRMGRLRPYLEHGILDLDNTAERAIGAIALGRKNDLFVGSASSRAAAIAYTLIETQAQRGRSRGLAGRRLASIPSIRSIRSTNFPWHRRP